MQQNLVRLLTALNGLLSAYVSLLEVTSGAALRSRVAFEADTARILPPLLLL